MHMEITWGKRPQELNEWARVGLSCNRFKAKHRVFPYLIIISKHLISLVYVTNLHSHFSIFMLFVTKFCQKIIYFPKHSKYITYTFVHLTKTLQNGASKFLNLRYLTLFQTYLLCLVKFSSSLLFQSKTFIPL